MSKKRKSKGSFLLDMTAMCDVAFLLLTFFILTAKFKPEEQVIVDLPSSTSELKLSDQDILQISLSTDGKVFLSMNDAEHRIQLLQKIGSMYNVTFNEEEMTTFEENGWVATSMKSMKQYLKSPSKESSELEGVPMLSKDNELAQWVLRTRELNPKTKICVKGDKNAQYHTVKKIIDILQDQNINKFHLITTLE